MIVRGEITHNRVGIPTNEAANMAFISKSVWGDGPLTSSLSFFISRDRTFYSSIVTDIFESKSVNLSGSERLVEFWICNAFMLSERIFSKILFLFAYDIFWPVKQ